MIKDEESNCPGERVVLAGYSQGALVIHIVLRELANDDPSVLGSHIAAVLLMADPAKVSNGAEDTWEADLQQAGAGVENADGIWTKLPGLRDSDKGPISSSVVGQTLALCHNHDIVCSPDWALAFPTTPATTARKKTTWASGQPIHTSDSQRPLPADSGGRRVPRPPAGPRNLGAVHASDRVRTVYATKVAQDLDDGQPALGLSRWTIAGSGPQRHVACGRARGALGQAAVWVAPPSSSRRSPINRRRSSPTWVRRGHAIARQASSR